MSFPLTSSVVDNLLADSVAQAKQGVRGANPIVGAVIADGHGNLVAAGHHRGAGTAHAEVDALHHLNEWLEGCESTVDPRTLTMFVTLEPCNHTGRTGPCSRAILDAGIGRVVFAVSDATDQAAGGAAFLTQHGVEVVDGTTVSESWVSDAQALNERWFAAQDEGRPFTTLHLAQTLDANIAAIDGTSQWITGAESREHSHEIRSRVDAIVVGTGTIFADNPQLTARDANGELLMNQPLRVAMGQREVPETARIRGDGTFVQVRTHDPKVVLTQLAQRGVSHVLIEGGSSVATAFLKADLVDEIWLYQAPKFLGRGRSALDDLGISTLSKALQFDLDEVDGPAVRQSGTDVLVHLKKASEK